MKIKPIDDKTVEITVNGVSYKVVPGFMCTVITDLIIFSSEVVLIKEVFSEILDELPKGNGILLSICRKREDGVYHYVGDMRFQEMDAMMCLSIHVSKSPKSESEIVPGSGEWLREGIGGDVDIKVPRPEESMNALYSKLEN